MNYTVKDLFQDIADFNFQVLGKVAPPEPTLLSPNRFEYAQKCLLEELEEFRIAYEKGDIAAVADALVDLNYFSFGFMFEMGTPPGPIWDEVHRANMTKTKGMTKRGHPLDATKPDEWSPPDHSWLSFMSYVLVEAAKLRAKKNADYNEGVALTDYFPFGIVSYVQMMHVKCMRLVSLARVHRLDAPANESIRDTALDLINYSTYMIEELDREKKKRREETERA